jgi:predicted PurR-regulated permease PerM
MDRVGDFFAERTPRRVMAIVLFLVLVYLFRHLAPILVFFVMFERSLTFMSKRISERTGVKKKFVVLGLILAFAAGLAGVGTLEIGRAIRGIPAMREQIPHWFAAAQDNPLIAHVHERIGDTHKILEGAKDYAGAAFEAAALVGHFLLYALIGFILAIVFVIEESHIEEFAHKVAPRSLIGTLMRWLGHLADATIVTIQLQFVVALCNTVLTLPLLFALGIPHKGALMLLIFVSALIPVIGNLVSGAVLSVLAYQAKGPVGLGIFVVLTFVLHKIESYYLNPRLTSRHVHLPGFVLILSLIACEHLFGFVGFFISFPMLFVAGRIRAEFLEEEGKLAQKRAVEVPSKKELPAKPPSKAEN